MTSSLRDGGRHRPTGNYVCDDCGQPFLTSEALGGHTAKTDCTQDGDGDE